VSGVLATSISAFDGSLSTYIVEKPDVTQVY